MRRERTGDDDVARPALDHVRQHVVHILHHDVDIQVQHPVNGPGVGIDQIAADIRTCVCMQDVELACLLQDFRQQRSAVLLVEQVDDQRDHRVAVLVAECRQRCLVPVDHHDTRACRQHRLGTGQSDARRSPGHSGNLAFQFSRHGSPPCWSRHNTRRVSCRSSIPPRAAESATDAPRRTAASHKAPATGSCRR